MTSRKGVKNITIEKWEEMKLLYVTKNKSLREIEEQFGYSHAIISKKSAEGSWVDERTKYWANVSQELANFISQEMVEVKKNMLKTGLYLFGKGLQHLQKKLDKADKNRDGLSDKESWAYFNKGVEMLSKFMVEEKNIELHLPQSAESEAAREMRRFFDKLHGVQPVENTEP